MIPHLTMKNNLRNIIHVECCMTFTRGAIYQQTDDATMCCTYNTNANLVLQTLVMVVTSSYLFVSATVKYKSGYVHHWGTVRSSANAESSCGRHRPAVFPKYRIQATLLLKFDFLPKIPCCFNLFMLNVNANYVVMNDVSALTAVSRPNTVLEIKLFFHQILKVNNFVSN